MEKRYKFEVPARIPRLAELAAFAVRKHSWKWKNNEPGLDILPKYPKHKKRIKCFSIVKYEAVVYISEESKDGVFKRHKIMQKVEKMGYETPDNILREVFSHIELQ